MFGSKDSADTTVRKIRNQLEVEAVSLVSADSDVIASTSDTLVGSRISNPLLLFGLGSGRLAALADAVPSDIEIDGVATWNEGMVLYQVIAPLDDGAALLMHYDISELLSRRIQPGELQPLTTQLAALGVIFAILGAAVFLGHTRAMRRHREFVVESELLRAHSEELETANELLEEARSRAEDALSLAEEKMRIRSEFVLMINHELRTPLTSVVTGARLIRDEDLGATERGELLNSLVANGDRLNEIIDQILAVARIENRGLAYELVDTSLHDVGDAAGAEMFLRADVDSMRVKTDAKTLALVIRSLSDNARTHGAETIRVTCSDIPLIEPMLEVGNRPSRAVYFGVADDGPGIDIDFLPRAFEKFEKSSFSSGTGLGLYMVRLMVEALGGSVGVTTSPIGTTFQIAVPATQSRPALETV